MPDRLRVRVGLGLIEAWGRLWDWVRVGVKVRVGCGRSECPGEGLDEVRVRVGCGSE